jgi:hypothetical protein
MSFQDISAEKLAELFHHYHQALGPDFGCGGRAIADSWNQVPQPEKSRMVAAARLTLLELDSTHDHRERADRFFAKAGEAEWGA